VDALKRSNALADLPDTSVSLEALDRPGIGLIAHLREVRHLIIVDAAQTGGVAGTIYRWSGLDLAHDDAPLSTHDLGVAAALRLARELGSLPSITVYAVEGASAALSDSLSAQVEASLDELVTRIVAEIRVVIRKAG
jgi:hydrogenase maturation protease